MPRKKPLHDPMKTRSPATVGVEKTHPPASNVHEGAGLSVLRRSVAALFEERGVHPEAMPTRMMLSRLRRQPRRTRAETVAINRMDEASLGIVQEFCRTWRTRKLECTDRRQRAAASFQRSWVVDSSFDTQLSRQPLCRYFREIVRLKVLISELSPDDT